MDIDTSKHTKFEVTFHTPNGGKWTACYLVPNIVTNKFGWVEGAALDTLTQNKDKDSAIFRIEEW